MYKLANDSNNNNVTTTGGLKSDAIFKEIQERAENEKEMVKGINTSFRITVSNGKITKNWTIDLKQDPPFIGESDRKVDVEVTVKDDDFILMAQGKLKPDQVRKF